MVHVAWKCTTFHDHVIRCQFKTFIRCYAFTIKELSEKKNKHRNEFIMLSVLFHAILHSFIYLWFLILKNALNCMLNPIKMNQLRKSKNQTLFNYNLK